MQRWTPEIIRYLLAAAEHCQYYTELARRLAPYLSASDRVCDAGCGVGLLSQALLPYCREVVAADRSAAALEELRRRVAGQPGLRLQLGDIAALPPEEPYDAMVFCLFGGVEEALSLAARQCEGTVLLVRRDYTHHQFSSGGRLSGQTAADMEAALARRGIRCQTQRFTLEFGQPFRSLDDAEAFFRLYSRDGQIPDRASLVRRLVDSGRADYPLYLPNPKPLCLFALSADQLRREDRE